MNLDRLPSQSVLDVSGTLARFGGDQQLFREILQFYLEDAPPLVAELRRAAEVSRRAAVQSTAHTLRGLVAGCGGIRAAQAAQRIEQAADEGDLTDLAPLLEKLEIELERLTQAAREHCG